MAMKYLNEVNIGLASSFRGTINNDMQVIDDYLDRLHGTTEVPAVKIVYTDHVLDETEISALGLKEGDFAYYDITDVVIT